MFTDQVTLELCAGKGGNGVVAWRREKYLPKGGPYGGNGGKGGSVILMADRQLFSLENYRNRHFVHAENGQQGASNNRQGRRGRDIIVKVPCGTLVTDSESGELLYDLTEHGEKHEICSGGRGGFGNTHFKSAKNRAPNYSTFGKEGESQRVRLELKLIADVGLVGFPNAGKSTLLSCVARAKSKAAMYPFTTLRPNLGYLYEEGYGNPLLLADIPGIISGAHQNKGLGLEFLRHIERTRILLFVLDASGYESRDPIEDFETLRYELLQHNPLLQEKQWIVVLNKIDRGFVGEEFQKRYASLPIFAISALTKENVSDLTHYLKSLQCQ